MHRNVSMPVPNHPLERLKIFRYVDSSQLCRARRGPIAAISDLRLFYVVKVF
jgi:hypothetical protein